MAGALMACALRHVPWTIDSGRGVALERDGLVLALLKSLLGGAQRGGDALPLVGVPTSGEEQAGPGGDEEKDRRHG